MATLEVFCYIYMLYYFITVWLFTFSIGLYKYWKKISFQLVPCVFQFIYIVHFSTLNYEIYTDET